MQKVIRQINRDPTTRKLFFERPEEAIATYSLTEQERSALLRKDYGELYRLGVHGLLLRPFSILHSVPEADYLEAIRKGDPR